MQRPGGSLGGFSGRFPAGDLLVGRVGMGGEVAGPGASGSLGLFLRTVEAVISRMFWKVH